MFGLTLEFGGYLIGFTRIISQFFFTCLGINFMFSSKIFLDPNLPPEIVKFDKTSHFNGSYEEIHFPKEQYDRYGHGKNLIFRVMELFLKGEGKNFSRILGNFSAVQLSQIFFPC